MYTQEISHSVRGINCYTQVSEICSDKAMQKQGILTYPNTFSQQNAWFEKLSTSTKTSLGR